jgi:hypothetical protein
LRRRESIVFPVICEVEVGFLGLLVDDCEDVGGVMDRRHNNIPREKMIAAGIFNISFGLNHEVTVVEG